MADGLHIAGLKSALAGPFDLVVEPGECVSVMGASGAGKSLFLRMIADLDPNEGEVGLAGQPRSAMPAPTWRRQAVYVPAESGWWTDRIADHIAPDGRGAAEALASRFGLPAGILDEPVSRLSSGERQRLALIRALVLEPPALLLDEPTASLDATSIERVEATLRERLQAGCAIVLVSHDAAQAQRLASRHFTMRAGRLDPAP